MASCSSEYDADSLPSVSYKRCWAERRHSLCAFRTLCTWSRSASHRTGSRYWSSPLHVLHTAAAAAALALCSQAWKRHKGEMDLQRLMHSFFSLIFNIFSNSWNNQNCSDFVCSCRSLSHIEWSCIFYHIIVRQTPDYILFNSKVSLKLKGPRSWQHCLYF